MPAISEGRLMRALAGCERERGQRRTMRVCVCLLLLVLMQVLPRGTSGGDTDTTHTRNRRGIFTDTWRRWTGPQRSSCGPPDACPPHHCRLDDAVVHGFCCGCAHPTDRVPIRCPPWLKCPYSPLPLCDDYNYMMDCCC